MEESTQLAVFTATSVIAAVRAIGILGTLALNAETYAGDGFTAGFRNDGIAFPATLKAFTARQFSARTGNRLFDASVDLILHRTIPAPTSSHDTLADPSNMSV
jgi:hypothetical protein